MGSTTVIQLPPISEKTFDCTPGSSNNASEDLPRHSKDSFSYRTSFFCIVDDAVHKCFPETKSDFLLVMIFRIVMQPLIFVRIDVIDDNEPLVHGNGLDDVIQQFCKVICLNLGAYRFPDILYNSISFKLGAQLLVMFTCWQLVPETIFKTDRLSYNKYR